MMNILFIYKIMKTIPSQVIIIHKLSAAMLLYWPWGKARLLRLLSTRGLSTFMSTRNFPDMSTRIFGCRQNKEKHKKNVKNKEKQSLIIFKFNHVNYVRY